MDKSSSTSATAESIDHVLVTPSSTNRFSRFCLFPHRRRSSTAAHIDNDQSTSDSVTKSSLTMDEWLNQKTSPITSHHDRKSQWKLFKHSTLLANSWPFFGYNNSKKIEDESIHHQLRVPQLTIRQPSIELVDDRIFAQSINCARLVAISPPIADNQYDHVDTPTSAPAILSSSSTIDDCASGYMKWKMMSRKHHESSESRTSSGYIQHTHGLYKTNYLNTTNNVSIIIEYCYQFAGYTGGSGGDTRTSSRDDVDESSDIPAVPSTSTDPWKASQRLLWKLKPRNLNLTSASSSIDSAWKSLDSNTWRSVDGTELHLFGTRLEYLSEIERQAMQKIAITRLNKLLPSVNISKPKDGLALKQKRQKLIKGNRSHTVNVVASSSTDKRTPPLPVNETKHVFGISLSECMQNDLRIEAEQRCRSLDESDTGLLLAVPPSSNRLSQRLSSASTKSANPELETVSSNNSSRSISTTTTIQHTSESNNDTNLLIQSDYSMKSVSGLSNASSSSSMTIAAPKQESFEPHIPQIPKIVETCTDYLKKHGLYTVGLFRQSGSAKRCRQMRVELDSGQEVVLFDVEGPGEYQPHDIATLLKEYFRDLPDALLSQELYQAFIAAAKLNYDDRIECIRLLFSLLATANCDTVLVLLKFLQDVASRSMDEYDDAGQLIRHGNKMDVKNLATIFAPSILRPPDHTKLQASLTESDAQISIVETMIESISKELQSQIYARLRDIDPDGLDKLLNQLIRCGQYNDDSAFPSEPQVYFTTSEESFPNEISHESDGTTLIRTRTTTTQRIVYRSGIGSSSTDSAHHHYRYQQHSPFSRYPPTTNRNHNKQQQSPSKATTSGNNTGGQRSQSWPTKHECNNVSDDAVTRLAQIDDDEQILESNAELTTQKQSKITTNADTSGKVICNRRYPDANTTTCVGIPDRPNPIIDSSSSSSVTRRIPMIKGRLSKVGGYVTSKFRSSQF